VAALMNHSEEPASGGKCDASERFILNERELLELNKFINQPERDFAIDLFKAVSSLSDTIKERAYKFVFFVNPLYKSTVKEVCLEYDINQINRVLDNMNTGIYFDIEPLKPILESIKDYINNGFFHTSGRVEEIIDTPLLITER
jgi:hypothetical protein